MDNGFSLRAVMDNVVENLVVSIGDFVPRLLTALVVILIGILLAKIVARVIRTSFERFKIDALLERIGLTEHLQKLGLKEPPGQVLARAVYYLLVLLFVQSGCLAAGLHTIAGAIGAFFLYLPNIVAALVVVLIGMVVAQFIGRTVTQAATDSGVEFAPMLGRMVTLLIMFVVFIMAITQLQIDTHLVRSVALVLLAGIAIALALSFGLGTRDITRNLVAGFYARKLLRSGEKVEIGGERGVLHAITPIQTLIERDDQILAIPNRVFLDEIVKQSPGSTGAA